jgi:hypothetical protein
LTFVKWLIVHPQTIDYEPILRGTIVFMTATGHAVIGVVIAAKFANPLLAVPLALVSHLAADAFPHWDLGTNAKSKTKMQLRFQAAADVIVGFIVCYLIIFYLFPQTNLIYAFFIIIAAQLFDWLTMPYYFFNIKISPFTDVYKLQKHFDSRLDKPWGIINQVLILVLLIVVAKLF